MNFKFLMSLGMTALILPGCTSLQKNKAEPFQDFVSPQALIEQKQLNGPTGKSKAYIYDWGTQHHEYEPESLYPRKYLSQYCSVNGGKFSLLQQSNLNLIEDPVIKKRLASNRNVKQGIGAYQCDQGAGKSWIVSIEPAAEQKYEDKTAIHTVNLQTRIMSKEESQRFYAKASARMIAPVPAKRMPNNSAGTKNTVPARHLIEKETELKKENDLSKPLEPKKENKNAGETASFIAETPQSQQLKYYVAARKDLSKGQNQLTACNNAEKAYRYGKLYSTNGSNVYAESGVLVAKCLTTVPAYKRRFSNPKARAVGILQDLSANQNHAGAKYLLKQIQ